MLCQIWNSKLHFVCRGGFGDQDREGNVPCGVVGLCCLEDDVANDCGKINLWPHKDIVNEVGHLKGEVVAMSCWDEIVGENSPKKFHHGLSRLKRELAAPTDVFQAQLIN